MVCILPIQNPMMLGIYEGSTKDTKVNCLDIWSPSRNLSSSLEEGGWEAFRLSVGEGSWAR
jgi:hypothetical protein